MTAACPAWGYRLQPDRWTALFRPYLGAATLPNSAESLIWNSDTLYLKQMALSAPLVPTQFCSTLDEMAASQLRRRFRSETLVAKPRWGRAHADSPCFTMALRFRRFATRSSSRC